MLAAYTQPNHIIHVYNNHAYSAITYAVVHRYAYYKIFIYYVHLL